MVLKLKLNPFFLLTISLELSMPTVTVEQLHQTPCDGILASF